MRGQRDLQARKRLGRILQKLTNHFRAHGIRCAVIDHVDFLGANLRQIRGIEIFSDQGVLRRREIVQLVRGHAAHDAGELQTVLGPRHENRPAGKARARYRVDQEKALMRQQADQTAGQLLGFFGIAEQIAEIAPRHRLIKGNAGSVGKSDVESGGHAQQSQIRALIGNDHLRGNQMIALRENIIFLLAHEGTRVQDIGAPALTVAVVTVDGVTMNHNMRASQNDGVALVTVNDQACAVDSFRLLAAEDGIAGLQLITRRAGGIRLKPALDQLVIVGFDAVIENRAHAHDGVHHGFQRLLNFAGEDRLVGLKRFRFKAGAATVQRD